MKLDRIDHLNGLAQSDDIIWIDKKFESSFSVTGTSEYVFTVNDHGIPLNNVIRFTTTNQLPTNIVVGTDYFAKDVTTNTFKISATSGGAAIGGTIQSLGDQRIVGYISKNANIQQLRDSVNVKLGFIVAQLFPDVVVGDTKTVNIPTQASNMYTVDFYIDNEKIYISEQNKTTSSFDVVFDYLPDDLGTFKIVVTL